ncbi:TonB-dependent receptor plug domain-containing protein [Curvibacter sp. HBC61]|uniref:TonB-dependent receptor plug domain-containing protein n=1 Tax=Curvibacter cyanobacteriorum TaxID=3026422 RepID=A0ABT5N3M9_9BURK|nr:TonB-dependent receptor [Curvibacter sp. HBC61]MDD0840677.1 TonB-dependent receptor plug domain-containing protein [Curvibacter sp. HBC61]
MNTLQTPVFHAPRWPLVAWLLTCAAGAAPAQTADGAEAAAGAPPRATLAPVVITGHHYDNSVGSSDAASQGVIRSELLVSRPALRPGEVLEFIPGVIVTQHSGDGKANQYFLRGFNLDHGTDFATTVNGMPVNMPSHGHGQGYTDLNFLIPELVERIDYRKGPYFATQGDFASAGAADIHYKTRLDAPFAQVSVGQNGYRRGVAAGSVALQDDVVLLGAVEWMGNNGPWVVPEGLHRQNAVLRLTQGSAARGLSLSLMAYEARWNASDQVPQRLVDAGRYNGQAFGRYSTVDPSDGGNTSRYSLSGEWHDRDAHGETRASAYAMKYALKLFSNFTYAMDRPATGDQFLQQDDRNVFGGQVSRAWNQRLAGLDARLEVGAQLRNDRIQVGLFDTQARQTLATTRVDDIRQTQLGVYGQGMVQLSPWLRSVLGLRGDTVRYAVTSLSNAANSGSTRASLLSPKFSLVAGPWAQTELFFNAGKGFHSNDARGTTARVDPRSGEPVDAVPGLVASRGWELGLRTEAIPQWQSSLAYWALRSNSELVYVGDAGTTEPSGASRRRGIEFNNRWTPHRHFLLDADLAWTHARFVNGDRIPNAVDSVASVAATLRDLGPWSASLQWRYLGSGALVEDNSVRSSPASTFNLRVTRDLQAMLGRPSGLTVDVFNLFNRRVNDIQYYYASQLVGETSPVNDRVVHPAEPRSVRITYRTRF